MTTKGRVIPLTEVISIRFRGGSKTYYFDPNGLTIEAGQYVIVETASGHEYAQCCEGNHEVPEQSVVKPLRPVVRLATDNDRRTNELNRKKEKEDFAICEKKIAAHKLEMKLIRVESNFDGSKIIFFFTAEGRVDFRELVRDLANVFRSRIELRQVGVRDEAKMIGGLGICGRPLCCSQFLEEFMPVSIKMAKTQNLSLNPTKISGTCGRLMCCLKYEQNAYEDAMKRMPKNDSFVNTPDGPGNITSVDLLREEAKVKLDDSTDPPRTYKGCELQVLRNGKGSREGIEIPKERPERYIPPEAAEDRDRLGGLLSDYSFREERPRQEEAGDKGEKRSRRRRSRGRGGDKSAAQAAGPEMEIGKIEKVPVKISGSFTAEKKAAADRRAAQEQGGQKDQPPKEGGRRRRRGGGGEKGERKPQEQKPPVPQEAQPAAEKSGEAAKRRRHRPRRRRSGGGGGEAPAGE